MRVTVLCRYRAQTIRAFTTRQAHASNRGAPDTVNARRPWRAPSGVSAPGYPRVAGPTIQLLRRAMFARSALLGRGEGAPVFVFLFFRYTIQHAVYTEKINTRRIMPTCLVLKPYADRAVIASNGRGLFFPPTANAPAFSNICTTLLRPAERRSPCTDDDGSTGN